MRRGKDGQFLSIKGTFIGVNLGADYCAEHEWGIERIRYMFGVPGKSSEATGLVKRQVTKTHKDLQWVEFNGIQGLSTDDREYVRTLHPPKPETWVGYWDEANFAVLSSDPTKIAQLKEVFDAFQRNDVAIWVGGGGVFQNGGLCLAIASRIPKEYTDKWYASDVEAIQIRKDFKATGIEDYLAKAGKRYFALTPHRAPKEEAKLIFWLNPMDQNRNNYGWFNLSQLREWAKDKGPIPMTTKERKRHASRY